MNWYYAHNGQQLGPVDDAGLDALIADGTLKPDSLVWADGMANWQPLSQARSSGTGTPASGGVCSQCGGTFPPESLIRIADRSVCAACKPAVLQQLQEGVLLPGGQTHEFGGFWIRFGAKIIDGLVMAIPIYAINFGLAFAMFGVFAPQPDPNNLTPFFAYQGIVTLINMVIGMAYSGFFLSKYSATPGKMACGLKVIRADGTEMTFWRGAVRYLGEFVSTLTCFIGYIMAGFDEEKRALHDRICGTRVVKK
jgi:uncharacterized RDD family membrane protein YckC